MEYWLIVLWLTAQGQQQQRTVVPYQTMVQCEQAAVSMHRLVGNRRRIDTQCICVAPAKPKEVKL